MITRLIRDGLRLLLEEPPVVFEVVGEASDGQAAIELALQLRLT